MAPGAAGSGVSSLTSVPDFAVVALAGETVAEVHGSAWPLHLTIALFDADASAVVVVPVVAQAAARVAPFEIEPGQRADFGVNGDVPVTRVVPDEPPRALHLLLTEIVVAAGWRMRDPYWGTRFAPHITDAGGQEFADPARIDSIDLYEHAGGSWVLRASCPLAAETRR